MAESATSSVSRIVPPEAMRLLVLALIMIGVAAGLLGAGLLGWTIGRGVANARVHTLVGAIAAGLGSAASLGGAMHFLDASLDAGAARKAWLRWAVLSNKRFLMVVQILATGIAAGAAVALWFGY